MVHVPRKEVPAFETEWESMRKTPTKYTIENDQLALAEVTFTTFFGKTYKYSNQASLTYATTQIDYKFDPIEINVAAQTQTAPKGTQTISAGELGNYIETNVRQQSIVTNNKSQTPTVTPAAAMSDRWKGMKLR